MSSDGDLRKSIETNRQESNKALDKLVNQMLYIAALFLTLMPAMLVNDRTQEVVSDNPELFIMSYGLAIGSLLFGLGQLLNDALLFHFAARAVQHHKNKTSPKAWMEMQLVDYIKSRSKQGMISTGHLCVALQGSSLLGALMLNMVLLSRLV